MNTINVRAFYIQSPCACIEYMFIYKVLICPKVQLCVNQQVLFVLDRNKSGHSCPVCMSPYSHLWHGYLGYRL